MTRGDYQTFYPYAMGIGAGYPGNFESSYDEDTDPELNDQNDDQESTEYENEQVQVADVVAPESNPAPQPGKCGFWDFRNKVKQKKAELKAQYGKGRISVFECGIMPVRADITKYNPVVRIGESKTCVGWEPSCSKKCLGICCGPLSCVNWFVIPGNTQAYDNATARYNSDKAAWDKCRSENKGVWVPGWRRQWRKFIKNGGLKQLAQQCKAEMQGVPGSTRPPRTFEAIGEATLYEPQTSGGYFDVSSMTCKQIANKFGIVPGSKWGTAPENVKAEWVKRGCTKASVETGIDPETPEVDETAQRSLPADSEKKDNTKMFLIVGVVLIIAVAGFFVFKTVKGK